MLEVFEALGEGDLWNYLPADELHDCVLQSHPVHDWV